MLLLVASANRDERRYPDGERFNIHRQGPPHITFGRGIHSCLGSALARVEGRVALQELLKRFPNGPWTSTTRNCPSTSTVRGWDNLPAFIGKRTVGKAVRQMQRPRLQERSPVLFASQRETCVAGEAWELTLATPMGPQVMTLQIVRKPTLSQVP